MTAALFLIAVIGAAGVIALKVVDLTRQWRFDQLEPWQSRTEPWHVIDDGLPLWAARVRPVRPPPYDWEQETPHDRQK